MKRERVTKFEVRGLTQKFDDFTLFENIDLDIQPGKMIAIMGAPGCGKSVFLKILTGLVDPSSGSVNYNDKDICKISFENSVSLRLSTAICFENGGLLMNKTLEDNLKLSLLYHDQWRSDRSKSLFDGLVRDFKLKDYLHLRPAQVSAGVRKIAGLVRSFLLNPQIIFLDEPSLGIGPEATLMLKKWINIFRQEHEDKVVFIATQDIALAKLLNAEIWELKHKSLMKVA